jgi:hypothetical protein
MSAAGKASQQQATHHLNTNASQQQAVAREHTDSKRPVTPSSKSPVTPSKPLPSLNSLSTLLREHATVSCQV